MTRSRDAILEELRRAEASLKEMGERQAQTRAAIEALRAELATVGSKEPASIPRASAADGPVGLSPADKVRLFRSLFRGRADIFPVRFVSKRTSKPGYAPACSNKWQPQICLLKSGGKCTDCANQAFVPITDQVVIDHLQGRHVVGVYPLLEDETCWFLAVDFDGGSWRDDTATFAATCKSVGFPVAIERSRSGNGAHAWFFFSAQVAAEVARRMGCYLLTESMSRRHELSMKSYDRLFPNQDTMPRGGFGNLIALPLQHEPRRHGNTVFIDEHLQPFANQWAFLASLQRLEPDRVEAIAREATRTGRVIGVRFPSVEDDADFAPWSDHPSRETKPLADALPSEVKAVLAQRLYIEKAGLPSPALNRLKRLAAFQNPEFYKKQRMRLSTAMTPRVISCAEDLAHHVSLPRGCLLEARKLLEEHRTQLRIEDQRCIGTPLDLMFAGQLSALQKQAAQALVEHDIGIIVAPPGSGKTVLGTYLVAKRACSTLILVHRKPLLDQWRAQLAIFLGLDEKAVGQIGGGQRKPNGRLDVAMIQSLVRREKVDPLVCDYGQVIVDECHHVPAVSFERLLSEVKARYLVGLTATPQRRDGHQAIAEMQLGPVRLRVDAKSQSASRSFAHRLIVRETGFRTAPDHADLGIQDVYRELAGDVTRNQLIIEDIISTVEEGRSPILLTERKDHLEMLAEKLRGFVRHLIVLKGGRTSAKERRDGLDRLATIPDSEERVVLATGRYIGEGFDDARLDTLFLAMPVSWKGTLIQYAGRLHRHHPSKKEVRIYDYVDREVPMLLRMFARRLTTYRAIGYARGEAPLGLSEPAEQTTVEYDESALRHFDADV